MLDLRLELIKRHPRIEEVFKLWQDSLLDYDKNMLHTVYQAGNKLLGELFPACIDWEKLNTSIDSFPPLSELGYDVFRVFLSKGIHK